MMYTDEALKVIQANTMELYAKLARMKPDESFTCDDIRSTMYYLKAFCDECRHEEYMRKVAEIQRIRKQKKTSKSRCKIRDVGLSCSERD